MKQQIIESINDAEKLEKLYRKNPKEFAGCFVEISSSYDSPLLACWKIRLEADKVGSGEEMRLRDVIEVLSIAFMTALPVLIPALFISVDKEFFFLRDLGIIGFAGLIVYSLRINGLPRMKVFVPLLVLFAGLALYMNLLPSGQSDTVALAILHAPLLLWFLLGVTCTKFSNRGPRDWIDFVRFSGELIVMTGLILMAGGALTVLTAGLFQVIGTEIMPFYLYAVAIPGAAAAPVIAWFLIRSYPGITGKIAPVIARIFTPVVLITLTIYLVSLAFSKTGIMENREMLLVFNVMLVGVMALIIFSFSGISRELTGRYPHLASLLLSVLAIVVNTVALVAILSRVFEGLTPNRTAVMITNILIFINLILITPKLYCVTFKGASSASVGKTTAIYLWVYAGWCLIAIFILPLLFGYR